MRRRIFGGALVDADEGAGVGIWKGAEENAVDEREDGGRGADAQGDGEDGDEGEGRGAPQRSEGDAHVAHQVFDGTDAAYVARFGAIALDAAKPDVCAAPRF